MVDILKKTIIRLIEQINNRDILVCIYEFIQGLLS